jgi:signal transduction histidine kinase
MTAWNLLSRAVVCLLWLSPQLVVPPRQLCAREISQHPHILQTTPGSGLQNIRETKAGSSIRLLSGKQPHNVGSIAIDLGFAGWNNYGWCALAVGVMICETALLAFLLVRSRAKHRHDECALRDVSGRLINAQEEERRRIARELHDDINQQLAVLAIELQSLESAAPQLTQLQLKERLRSLWKRTNITSEDLQHISHRLHPSKLEFLGLVGALRGLGNEFKQMPGIEMEVQIRAIPVTPSKEVSLALFRVAQEALHNSEKHSKARHARLELLADGDDVVLRVSDDGVGFNPSVVNGKSLGIHSMEERLRLIGGKLVILSHPGTGTRIEARVPLRISAMPLETAS